MSGGCGGGGHRGRSGSVAPRKVATVFCKRNTETSLVKEAAPR